MRSYIRKCAQFGLVAVVAGASGYCTAAHAGSKADAQAAVGAAKAALSANDVQGASKALVKAKRALRARQRVQEALQEVEAILAQCTTDADCESKFGKGP